MSTTTNHVAEVAVAGQLQITVRADRGELELAQEYDGEHHAIYVQPVNVLTLIRAMLCMVGMEDVYLYEQKAGALCHDVDWPDGNEFEDVAETEEKPAPLTNAERQRLYRERHRNENSNEIGGLPLPHVNGADQQKEVLHAAE